MYIQLQVTISWRRAPSVCIKVHIYVDFYIYKYTQICVWCTHTFTIIRMYIRTHRYTCTNIYTSQWAHVNLHRNLYTCVYVDIWIVYIYKFTLMHVWYPQPMEYIYMCICGYMDMYIYTNSHSCMYDTPSPWNIYTCVYVDIWIVYIYKFTLMHVLYPQPM